jgi:hypothetical protein
MFIKEAAEGDTMVDARTMKGVLLRDINGANALEGIGNKNIMIRNNDEALLQRIVFRLCIISMIQRTTMIEIHEFGNN